MHTLKVVAFLVFTMLSHFTKSQTNVIFSLPGDSASEPLITQVFLNAYPDFSGKLKILEYSLVTDAMEYADSNGYNLIIRPKGINDGTTIQIDSFYKKGIQLIAAGGSNSYHYNTGSTNGLLKNAIICGAGHEENYTSIPVEFYDEPAHSGYYATNMKQLTGDTLLITVPTNINGIFFVTSNSRVFISSTLGFIDPPYGQYQVLKQIDNGLYNQFTISHNTIGGYFAFGFASVYYQSYAVATIGAKLAMVKDSLNCTIWEARYRCLMTGSNNGTFDSSNTGYGRINVTGALNYKGVIPPDPYLVREDVNNDGYVDFSDVILIYNNYGLTGYSDYDINYDYRVDLTDVLMVYNMIVN